MFTCYLLRCRLFGDTYVGVTGQPIRRRELQHYRSDRFPDGFTLEVLGEAESREEINRVERRMIAALRPTLNRIRGGLSVGGYKVTRKREAFCHKGHWMEDRYGKSICRTCKNERQVNYRLAKRDG